VNPTNPDQSSGPTEAQVHAALAAEADYLRERDDARRVRSQRIFGHAGAHIASEAPEAQERMRRALSAALDEEQRT
jgi:hypothetical protein